MVVVAQQARNNTPRLRGRLPANIAASYRQVVQVTALPRAVPPLKVTVDRSNGVLNRAVTRASRPIFTGRRLVS